MAGSIDATIATVISGICIRTANAKRNIYDILARAVNRFPCSFLNNFVPDPNTR